MTFIIGYNDIQAPKNAFYFVSVFSEEEPDLNNELEVSVSIKNQFLDLINRDWGGKNETGHEVGLLALLQQCGFHHAVQFFSIQSLKIKR